KPFSPREVVARVKAVLRRANGKRNQSNKILASDLEIDIDGFSVTQKGVALSLTPTEFILLSTLAKQPGRVYSRLQLLESSQEGVVLEGYERTIDAHIKNLRSKIEPDTKNPNYIETVFGVGYRFKKMP
ncbi:MAG: response regulator transcription factor, partial [Chloroflexota bacterium]